MISTNLPIRRDGKPYASAKAPDDPGVAVYFTRNDRQQCIPCDRWDRLKDNIQAIHKTVEALRGLDRWGARQIVDAAFSGFVALLGTLSDDWRSILGVPQDCSSPPEVKARYLRREYHPDHGGEAEMFHAVQRAWGQAQQELRKDGKSEHRVGRHS